MQLDVNDRIFLSDKTQSAPFWTFLDNAFEDLGHAGLNDHHRKTRKLLLARINRLQ
jgi:hypothetical protein